jgi:hypothetical protein
LLKRYLAGLLCQRQCEVVVPSRAPAGALRQAACRHSDRQPAPTAAAATAATRYRLNLHVRANDMPNAEASKTVIPSREEFPCPSLGAPDKSPGGSKLLLSQRLRKIQPRLDVPYPPHRY